jgi:hypothetical protein
MCFDWICLAYALLGRESQAERRRTMALADAGIRRGCAVTKLYLTGNRLGPDGVKSVIEAILEDELRRRKTSYGLNDTQAKFLGKML